MTEQSSLATGVTGGWLTQTSQLTLERGSVKPLATASRALVAEALAAIAEALNTVERHYFDTEGVMYDAGMGHGALMLLYHLRDGITADAERLRRLKAGEGRPDDLEQRPL